MKFKTSILFILFTPCLCFCQTITGIILDANTQEPIETASIYFDNTTIGTSSNNKGEFQIKKSNSNSPLVISYLGYEKIVLPNVESGKFYKILLNEAKNTLDEVLIDYFDGMSRRKKLNYFRNHFLGTTNNGKSCTILNEDDITLRFNKKTKQLVATSNAPILVRNENLQYNIKYDLKEFIIDYNHVNVKKRVFIPNSVVYKGTSFFESLSEEKSVQKKRKSLYKGSVLHFMRSLSENKLKEDGYQIISVGIPVEPSNYINVKNIQNTDSVNIKMRLPLTIAYKKWKQSNMILPNIDGKFDRQEHNEIVKQHDSIISVKISKKLKANAVGEVPLEEEATEVENKYYYNLSIIIDKYGNYSPVGSFYFTGYFSDLRIGDTLPLDYALKD
ncbi:carboxypeptidase-like regulatory domain-containing protein [Psychroserpens sp. AS72]|uniref:carboxypeptidase-like regulatory domain-containing protein n=1 Tax=Psychroserpens sp. AS72 TaxID=3135775 RepID=UPI00317D6994